MPVFGHGRFKPTPISLDPRFDPSFIAEEEVAVELNIRSASKAINIVLTRSIMQSTSVSESSIKYENMFRSGLSQVNLI